MSTIISIVMLFALVFKSIQISILKSKVKQQKEVIKTHFQINVDLQSEILFHVYKQNGFINKKEAFRYELNKKLKEVN